MSLRLILLLPLCLMLANCDDPQPALVSPASDTPERPSEQKPKGPDDIPGAQKGQRIEDQPKAEGIRSQPETGRTKPTPETGEPKPQPETGGGRPASKTGSETSNNENFWQALRSGDKKAVSEAISLNAEVKLPNEDGELPLNFAIKIENLDIIEALLKAGAKPNTKDGRGRTSAFFVSEWTSIGEKRRQILKSLLESGLDPNSDIRFGKTLLDWALERNDPRVVGGLLKRGAKHSHQTFKDYFQKNPKEQILRMFLLNGADPDLQSDYKERGHILFWAAQSGHQKLVKLLLDKGLSPDVRLNNNTNETVSEWIEKNGDAELKKLFSRSGQGQEQEQEQDDGEKLGSDENPNEVLWQALTSRDENESVKIDEDLVKIALRSGADPNFRNFEDISPLEWVLTKPYPIPAGIVKSLLKKGAIIDQGLANDYYSHYFADEKIVYLLVEYGANPNMTGGYQGEHVLYWAAYKKDKELVALLLEKGANVHARVSKWPFSRTILSWVRKKGDDSIKELFAKHDVDDEKGTADSAGGNSAESEEKKSEPPGFSSFTIGKKVNFADCIDTFKIEDPRISSTHWNSDKKAAKRKVKLAFKSLALRFHPDKFCKRSGKEFKTQEACNERITPLFYWFQQCSQYLK